MMKWLLHDLACDITIGAQPHRSQQRVTGKNKLSSADMYRWKLSSQEPCSMTCSIGRPQSTPIFKYKTCLLLFFF